MKTLTLLLLLCLSAGAPAATVYKWTDAAGGVHYGERPPAGQAQELRVPDHKPGKVVTPADRQKETQRLLDAIDKERQEKDKQAAAAAKEQAKRDEQCQQARRSAALYGMGGRIFDIDPQGERRYLSDAEIEQKRAAAQREVEKWCR